MSAEAENLKPIVLCHPACSGGSLIFKLLVAQFKFTGISEISHRPHGIHGGFSPTDPEYALFKAGLINDDEFSEIFLERIGSAISFARKQGSRLLIREHTHSYFFNLAPSIQIPNHPSWIIEQFHGQRGEEFKCIVSVRDPIDSWLGLIASFSDRAPPSFDNYCREYLNFVRTYDKTNKSYDVLLIRYEDVIEDPELELKRIADFMGVQYDGLSAADLAGIPSSGNSGRQSPTLEKRSRRPFEFQLVNQAENSEHYQELIKILDYNSIGQTITPLQKARSYFVPLLRSVAHFSYGFLRKLKSTWS